MPIGVLACSSNMWHTARLLCRRSARTQRKLHVRRCKQPGHWSRDCPTVGGSGSAPTFGGSGTARYDGGTAGAGASDAGTGQGGGSGSWAKAKPKVFSGRLDELSPCLWEMWMQPFRAAMSSAVLRRRLQMQATRARC